MAVPHKSDCCSNWILEKKYTFKGNDGKEEKASMGSVIDFRPCAWISADFTPLNTGRKRMLRMTSFGVTVMNIPV